jgi:hypothetical protein
MGNETVMKASVCRGDHLEGGSEAVALARLWVHAPQAATALLKIS